MFASEFGDGSRRPASEIRDGAGDRHGLPAGTLIRGDCESALDDGRGHAFPHAACPRFLWRLVDEAQWLADRGADDLGSLPVRHRFAACQYVLFADMSRLCDGDEGDGGNVAIIDVRNLAIAGRRVDGTF